MTDQLILFKPRGVDYAPHTTASPSDRYLPNLIFMFLDYVQLSGIRMLWTNVSRWLSQLIFCLFLFAGENLAMQRENEKSAVPVQQHQANKSATWKPRASIFQYCLTMISFWFYFLHVWIVKNRVSNTCTSANNNQRRRKVKKSEGANSNILSLSISAKSWGEHGPPGPSASDAPDNSSPLFCTGNPSRICNSW